MKKPVGPNYQKAEDLLQQIAVAQENLDGIRGKWRAAIEELERQYGEQAREFEREIEGLEKDLVKLAKGNKKTFFKDSDRLELQAGALLHAEYERVKRGKAVKVETLEVLGYTDGVRVEKKIAWDVLESWPEEKLVAVGTERVKKEKFEYELRNSKAT